MSWLTISPQLVLGGVRIFDVSLRMNPMEDVWPANLVFLAFSRVRLTLSIGSVSVP